MKFISHRGNLKGPNSCEENTFSAIENVINLGYECEIDVIGHKENNVYSLFLGHCIKQEKINDLYFLNNKNIWIHCKNVEALMIVSSFSNKNNLNLNYFFHNNDDYTITSHKIIWSYPGKFVPENGVMVLPENSPESMSINHINLIYGICSDYIQFFKSLYDLKNFHHKVDCLSEKHTQREPSNWGLNEQEKIDAEITEMAYKFEGEPNLVDLQDINDSTIKSEKKEISCETAYVVAVQKNNFILPGCYSVYYDEFDCYHEDVRNVSSPYYSREEVDKRCSELEKLFGNATIIKIMRINNGKWFIEERIYHRVNI